MLASGAVQEFSARLHALGNCGIAAGDRARWFGVKCLGLAASNALISTNQTGPMSRFWCYRLRFSLQTFADSVTLFMETGNWAKLW